MKAVMYKNVWLFADEPQLTQLSLLLEKHPVLAFDVSSIIETDQDGFIKMFKPVELMSWSTIFYIQNLMIIQRLHVIDEMRKK